MPDATFIQRSRVGMSIFMLRADHLDVTVYHFGAKSSRQIPLKSISSEYQLMAQRFWYLILVPLVLAAACIGVAYAILSEEALPHIWTIYVVIFFVSAVVATLRGVPRVEVFVFFDHWKKPLFFIVREAAQAEECNAFVHDIIDHIEERESDSPKTRSAHATGQSPGAAAAALRVAPKNRLARSEPHWMIALASGIFSAGYPLLAERVTGLGDWMFHMVFLGTFGGLLFGVLSFLAKERMRLLALVGMAFGLIAPVFY